MKLRIRRKFYGNYTFDEFLELDSAMFDIGFMMSAYPPDYGKATCLNCRAIVDVGHEQKTLEYGKQHREVCGDVNLPDLIRARLSERLAAIGGRP